MESLYKKVVRGRVVKIVKPPYWRITPRLGRKKVREIYYEIKDPDSY